MVVVGTSLFAVNQYFSVLGNKDFFLNIVRWLSEAPVPEIAHSIPKRPDVSPLVSLTSTESRIVFWSCVIIQPLIIFCIGAGVMFWRRYVC